MGNDTISFESDTGGVTVDLEAGTATGSGTGTDAFTDFENITGGSGADRLTGNIGNNVLRGNAGADILDGGEGDDTLRGDAGADTLDGGAGDDILDGGAGDDIFIASDGDDAIIAGGGADTLRIGSDYSIQSIILDESSGDLAINLLKASDASTHVTTIRNSISQPITTLITVDEDGNETDFNLSVTYDKNTQTYTASTDSATLIIGTSGDDKLVGRTVMIASLVMRVLILFQAGRVTIYLSVERVPTFTVFLMVTTLLPQRVPWTGSRSAISMP